MSAGTLDGSTARAYPVGMADDPITLRNGTRMYYKGNRRHREGGPAIEHADGRREWYRDGRRQPPPRMAELARSALGDPARETPDRGRPERRKMSMAELARAVDRDVVRTRTGPSR